MVIIRYVYSILTLILLLGSVSALASDLPPKSIINACAGYIDDDPDLLERIALHTGPFVTSVLDVNADDNGGNEKIFSFIHHNHYLPDVFSMKIFETLGFSFGFFTGTRYGIEIKNRFKIDKSYAILYGDQSYPIDNATLIGISAAHYQIVLKYTALHFEDADFWALLTTKDKQKYLCISQAPWEKAPQSVSYILSLSTKKRQLFYVEQEDHLPYD